VTVLLILTAWYGCCGLALVCISAAPGALIDIDTRQPKSFPFLAWVIIWLGWPYFLVCWTRNMLGGGAR
jgi:hypothetical protein